MMYVRHVSWCNIHRDLKHQTDNDVARIRTIKETVVSVDGRTNDSRNAEMMIKAIRPRRTTVVLYLFLNIFSVDVSDYYRAIL
jgi:hypothetical protein